jgi:hypothetical protein
MKWERRIENDRDVTNKDDHSSVKAGDEPLRLALTRLFRGLRSRSDNIFFGNAYYME